ncbi:LysM domain-containing protein [Cryobacterium sp. PAMC25264]|uniref:LysM peptidoglycan-binding domain-containing protein n=1 Tax=Cryobacterium sp. PAMC25264 TaxID=2861288 RepID=UPI001C634E41|nr:LysM domain-containing protein [Cryobacterium sp. PAMC25264]QYF72199.1 LysM peptidoglycan-binding domain-containing protein [Cryobacterium sp. PAMC25264]
MTGSMFTARRAFAVAALTVAAVALSGCAPAPAPVVTQTIVITPTPTPTPTPTATPTPVVTTPPVAAPVPEITENPDVPEVPLPEGPAYDNGAIPGAQAAPVRDDAGNLTSYTVIDGDTFFDIAQRFDLPMQQLLRMNPSVSGLGENIRLRQVINLDWTTTG